VIAASSHIFQQRNLKDFASGLLQQVVALLRQGLQGASRTSHVEEIYGEFVAIDRALERLSDGDLCLILIDQVDDALAHIAKRVAEA